MYNILIVDDELYVLNGLKKLLLGISKKINHVFMEQSGRNALQLMEREKIDIIFTDIKMPNMDGIELIERLAGMNINAKIIILSGFENFEYAQKAIANNIKYYLLKPITKKELQLVLENVTREIETERSHHKYVAKLEQQLEANLPILKEKFFYELAIGQYNQDMADFIQIQNHGSYNKVMLLSIDDDRDSKSNIDEKRKQLNLIQVTNSLNKFFEDCFYYIHFVIERNICVFLSSQKYQNNCNNFIEKQLKMFQKHIFTEYNLSISVGVSRTFKDIREFSNHYEQAATALEHKMYLGFKSLVFYDNISINTKTPVFSNFSNEKDKIYRALNSENHEQIMGIFSTLKNQFTCSSYYSPEFIKTLCLDIITMLQIFAYEQSIEIDHLYYDKKNPSEVIMKAETVEEIFLTIIETYEKIHYCLKKKMTRQIESLIVKIKKYVNEHLSEDVTLHTLSNVVFLTPNYIGLVFKRETGISFKEYVIQTRIKKAKALLLHENLKIYEIAEHVGYRSVNYFSKIFKTTTGVYPSEYKLHAEQS